MRKITSFTIHTTAEGERASFVYCDIDEEGNIIEQNKRGEVILIDDEQLTWAEKFYEFLETKIPE